MHRAISMAASGGQPFHLQLIGGEPTLVPGLVEEAAALAHDSGQCFSIGIQTNGTCLTSDLIGIIKKYRMEVGVSLDGPPAVHEHQRGMAAETLRGLQLLDREGIRGITACDLYRTLWQMENFHPQNNRKGKI